METELFGWRMGILFLMGLVFLYLAVTVIRLLRVGKRPVESGKEEPPLAEARVTESVPPGLSELVIPPTVSKGIEWSDRIDLDLSGGQRAESALAKSSSSPVTGFGEQLAEHLARSDLERELRQLRKEVSELRAELEKMRGVSNVSPQYDEAVALAQRGLTAQDVADRLGISLAEAELVHAMSRGESIFDEGEHDGTDREHEATSDAGANRYEPGIGYVSRRNGRG